MLATSGAPATAITVTVNTATTISLSGTPHVLAPAVGDYLAIQTGTNTIAEEIVKVTAVGGSGNVDLTVTPALSITTGSSKAVKKFVYLGAVMAGSTVLTASYDTAVSATAVTLSGTAD